MLYTLILPSSVDLIALHIMHALHTSVPIVDVDNEDDYDEMMMMSWNAI